MHLFSEILWHVLFPLVGLYTLVLFFIDDRYNLNRYSEFWSKHRHTFRTTVLILWYISAIAVIVNLEMFITKAKEEIRENTKNNIQTKNEYDISCKVGDIIVFDIQPKYDIMSAKGPQSVELIEKHRSIIKIEEDFTEAEIIVKIRKH